MIGAVLKAVVVPETSGTSSTGEFRYGDDEVHDFGSDPDHLRETEG